MAAIGSRVDVTAAATLIQAKGRYVYLKNTGTQTVDLGGANVASGAGYELAAGATLEIDCGVDDLYGICAAAQSSTVEVLAVRRNYSL